MGVVLEGTVGDAKGFLSFPEGTAHIEGSEPFVRECTARLVSKQIEGGASAMLVDKGLDHAWQWFSLHASHRMQAVDFFLVAVAFLSAAYVSALHFGLPAVAAGVAVLGVMASVCFYLFETRIRELLKAGEAALKPAQRALAELTGVAEFKICDVVERPKYWFTSYNKIIKILYGFTVVAFLIGFVYAAWSHFFHGIGGVRAASHGWFPGHLGF